MVPLGSVCSTLGYRGTPVGNHWPRVTNSLWKNVATDNQSLILWTHSGQRIDKESTAENVLNKVNRAFWTCKGTFDKTWGLVPKVVYRI
jgi:hypothetical protein